MKNMIVAVGLICVCLMSFAGCDQPQQFYSEVEFSQEVSDVPKTEVLLDKVKPKPVKKQKISTPIEEKIEVIETAVKEKAEPIVEEVVEPTVEETVEPVIEEVTEPIIEEPIIEEQPTVEEENIENTDGLTSFTGVNSYDGRTETYYSSDVLYHQDTDEWTVDDEGFYRTDEGYYVVAASDMPQGTTFEGSKGTCIVLDDGCDEGTTDYYTNW